MRRILLALLTTAVGLSAFLRVRHMSWAWSLAVLAGVLIPAAWWLSRRPGGDSDPVNWTGREISRIARTQAFLAALFFGTFMAAYSLSSVANLPMRVWVFAALIYGVGMYRPIRRGLVDIREKAVEERGTVFE